MLTMLLYPFFHLQEHTNPTTLMSAKQWAFTLFLLRLFEPFVFHNHYIT